MRCHWFATQTMPAVLIDPADNAAAVWAAVGDAERLDLASGAGWGIPHEGVHRGVVMVAESGIPPPLGFWSGRHWGREGGQEDRLVVGKRIFQLGGQLGNVANYLDLVAGAPLES